MSDSSSHLAVESVLTMMLFRCQYWCIFLKRCFAQKVYTACARTRYIIVPLNNSNKYLHYDASEAEVNVNISANGSSEKLYTVKPA